MNRIILIGNGFDRAHYLPTSYKHFINYYWEKTIKKVQKILKDNRYEDDDIIVDKVPRIWISGYEYNDFKKSINNKKGDIIFKNKFLEIITHKQYLQDWVEIENEYYSLLIETYERKHDSRYDYDILKLNADFERIKQYLINYLKAIENGDINIKMISKIDEIRNNIYSTFKFRDFTEEAKKDKVKIEYEKFNKNADAVDKHIVSLHELDEKQRLLISNNKGEISLKEMRQILTLYSNKYFNLLPKKILFLNFNYTDTDIRYLNYDETNIVESHISKERVQIHGSINEKEKNPIIFGFGDELDDKYKIIEDLNDNDYLDNIKSIKYLETANYKKLLEFINSESYQIFIFGHSCGISDRTLLNTLFEHKNCVSIKPYYFQKSISEDNYSDIVKNISRNFNNKSIMRDKVVNKEFCVSLKTFEPKNER